MITDLDKVYLLQQDFEDSNNVNTSILVYRKYFLVYVQFF